jgi:hypothetical protein
VHCVASGKSKPVRVTSGGAGADEFDSPHHSPRSLLNNQDSLRLQVPALPSAPPPATRQLPRAESGLSIQHLCCTYACSQRLGATRAERKGLSQDLAGVAAASAAQLLSIQVRCVLVAPHPSLLPPGTALCKRTFCQRKEVSQREEGAERDITGSSAALPCCRARGMAASCAHPATGARQVCGSPASPVGRLASMRLAA